jgi:hypothetical protein
MRKTILSLTLILTFVSVGAAQDLTFSKTKDASVKLPREVAVNLMLTDSQILIKSKKVSKKIPAIDTEIPYSSIEAMSHELSNRHRVQEGAALVGLSPAAGLILMTTKTKGHWLVIEHHEGDAKQLTVLRLDKSEYENVIAALEARTDKKVALLDAKTSPFNPTLRSKDVDEVVPFRMDKVVAALKPAMESVACKVTHETANRVECKRKGVITSERTGLGNGKITAKLEARGEQTRVRIRSHKVHRGARRNWSTPIYQEMMENLQTPA